MHAKCWDTWTSRTMSRFFECNLQNLLHPLRPSNISCFPPDWDKLLSGHLYPILAVETAGGERKKRNRGGRKSYPNIVEPHKKFQLGWTEAAEDLFCCIFPFSKLFASSHWQQHHLVSHWLRCFTACFGARHAAGRDYHHHHHILDREEEELQSCWDDFVPLLPPGGTQGKREVVAKFEAVW